MTNTDPPEDSLIDEVPEEPIRGGEPWAFFPPHNLGDVARALGRLIEHPRSRLEDVLRVLPAPDFPTGGLLMNPEALPEMYASGEGELLVRSRYRIEPAPRGRACVVVSEIPFGISKMELIERFAAAHVEGRLEGVSDIRDISDSDEIRIEIEAARGKDPKWILHQLTRDDEFDNRVQVRTVVNRNGKPMRVGLLDLLRMALDRFPPDPRPLLREWARRSDERRTSTSVLPLGE